MLSAFLASCSVRNSTSIGEFPTGYEPRTTNSRQGNPNVGAQVSSQNPSNSSSECWLTTEFKKKSPPCIFQYFVCPDWCIVLSMFICYVLGTYDQVSRTTEEIEKREDTEKKLQVAEQDCKNFKLRADHGNLELQALVEDISQINAELDDVRSQVFTCLQGLNLDCNVTKDLGSVSQVVSCAKPQMSTCADSVLAGQSTSEQPIALMALCTAKNITTLLNMALLRQGRLLHSHAQPILRNAPIMPIRKRGAKAVTSRRRRIAKWLQNVL